MALSGSGWPKPLTNLRGSLHNHNNGTNLQEASIRRQHTKSQQSHHRCAVATQQRSASLSARLLAATCFSFHFIRRNKEKAEKGKERGDRRFVQKKTFITAKERVVSRLGGRNKNVPTKQYESAVSVLVVSHAGPQWIHAGPQRRQRETVIHEEHCTNLSGQPRRATEEATKDLQPMEITVPILVKWAGCKMVGLQDRQRPPGTSFEWVCFLVTSRSKLPARHMVRLFLAKADWEVCKIPYSGPVICL